MGRKSKVFDDHQRAQVRAHAAYGTPHDVIADLMGCTPKTLRKYCQRELALGKYQANAEMAGALFKAGKEGNTVAQIFWLKTQAGWRETSSLEVTGKGGRPLFDIGKLSDEQLAALEGIVVSAGQATAARGDTRGEEVSEPPGQLH